MEIKYDKIQRMTISEFADMHDLNMVVRERHTGHGDNSLPRFYASFEHSEVSDRCMLIGKYGDGDTPEEAIKDYAKEISEKKLVLNAYRKNRVEIQVPCLLDEESRA